MFNGWKRYYALKYQAVVIPDGIISHFYGPVDGHRHDRYLWKDSGLEQLLEQYTFDNKHIPM